MLIPDSLRERDKAKDQQTVVISLPGHISLSQWDSCRAHHMRLCNSPSNKPRRKPEAVNKQHVEQMQQTSIGSWSDDRFMKMVCLVLECHCTQTTVPHVCIIPLHTNTVLSQLKKLNNFSPMAPLLDLRHRGYKHKSYYTHTEHSHTQKHTHTQSCKFRHSGISHFIRDRKLVFSCQQQLLFSLSHRSESKDRTHQN